MGVAFKNLSGFQPWAAMHKSRSKPERIHAGASLSLSGKNLRVAATESFFRNPAERKKTEVHHSESAGYPPKKN